MWINGITNEILLLIKVSYILVLLLVILRETNRKHVLLHWHLHLRVLLLIWWSHHLLRWHSLLIHLIRHLILHRSWHSASSSLCSSAASLMHTTSLLILKSRIIGHLSLCELVIFINLSKELTDNLVCYSCVLLLFLLLHLILRNPKINLQWFTSKDI